MMSGLLAKSSSDVVPSVEHSVQCLPIEAKVRKGDASPY